jgi:hypothetical protein
MREAGRHGAGALDGHGDTGAEVQGVTPTLLLHKWVAGTHK